MFTRRQALTSALAADVLSIALASAAAPAAAAPKAPPNPPGLCDGSNPIPVERLLNVLPLCDLTGRLAVGEGFSAVIPEAGSKVTLNALGINGDETELEVSHSRNGRVKAVQKKHEHDEETEEPQPAGVITGPSLGGQAACSDTAYTLKDAKESDTRRWLYNASSHPQPGSAAAGYHEQAVLSGVVDLTAGYNDCGLPQTINAKHYYAGHTTARSNTTTNSCTQRDNLNVVDWAEVYSGYLAFACTHEYIEIPGFDEITEGDIVINRQFTWLTSAPTSTCDNRYDLLSVMTHEWGHSFGLAHAPEPSAEHRQQTMHAGIWPCSTYARTLGRGDYNGLYAIYGSR